ncbi:Fis family transcriptional regulator [Gloeocapsopsis dulcis]|uniref:Fis family transcriptional regulator n=1 Tax=Gloeocapsopsis dulcis AAB1 = 1H9 TaxID=1433147 RepID=A0A6N8G182_9CHRO|nr:Fis family transcriptional regulator [Gloeocapsopsis dulcis]MUL37916.1 Fis family transcriptional regulator [Gloeocapsopsis dulcis AAB1 = 1H9]WNN87311.1 Fis family transcriptional regulator [Gloeocapsopsis dulcis]
MEPFSVLASVVTTIILPKVLEKEGEKIGEKIGEAAIEKSGETIQLARKTVQDKLQAAGTAGLLKRAEEKPTEQNIQVLEGELISQMGEDKEFAAQLEALLQQIQAQSPTLQVVLDTVRIKGSAKIGNIEQVSEDRSAEQIIGRNLGVEGDFEMGDITQRVQKK